MQYREWHFDDKSRWPQGPWQNEPDKVQWVDEETGLPCLIVRNTMGVLCGYVGVSEGHPWFRKNYDDVDAVVHGGLTFSSHCMEKSGDPAAPDRIVCHLVEDGDDDNVWWLGFDCCHYKDAKPALAAMFYDCGKMYEEALGPDWRSVLPDAAAVIDNTKLNSMNLFAFEVYRDIGYVKAECAKLARQAVEAANSAQLSG